MHDRTDGRSYNFDFGDDVVSRIVSKDDAVGIAKAHLVQLHGPHPALKEWEKLHGLRVTDAPARFNAYGVTLGNDMDWTAPWYVYVPWCDGSDFNALRSSRVVVVSKIGGRILYDGTANDEG